MPRIDRYILSQFLQSFGFFALVIAGVYWVNKAVGLFDQLIGDNQTIWVFLQFTLLTLPQVIKLILPISAFIATVYATNRLMADSEMVVMQATGFSPLRLARPVLWFGLIVALMAAILANVLVPQSRLALSEARIAVSENMTARLLEAGIFSHPTPQTTLFIREITPQGELTDIFLQDARSAAATVTYTAPSAMLLRGENGPKLIMIEGMAQTLDAATRRLSVTRFADFTYDLGGMLGGTGPQPRADAELSTPELLFPSAEVLAETGSSAVDLRFQGHQRLAEPFLALAVSLIGFAALIMGGFSRFGLWKQIGVAIALLVVVQGLATAAGAAGAHLAQGWVLAYAAPALGLALAGLLLAWAGRNRKLPEGRP